MNIHEHQAKKILKEYGAVVPEGIFAFTVDELLEKVKTHYKDFPILTIDGVKIEFPDGWVHLRPSNTEPILRIYAESTSMEKADQYAKDVIALMN